MNTRPPSSRRMRGMSLVELMVGIAVGLLIVAAATCVLVSQLHDHRRLMLETQLQQDLRTASDIIVRELRRSGYWGSAHRAAWFHGTPGVAPNPYAGVGLAGGELAFSYSRDAQTPARGSENDRIDDNAQSHILAAILGPSETVPVEDGKLLLGTWQTILLVELDGPRAERRVAVQVLGS